MFSKLGRIGGGRSRQERLRSKVHFPPDSGPHGGLFLDSAKKEERRVRRTGQRRFGGEGAGGMTVLRGEPRLFLTDGR